jgi:antitoxin MazE
MTIAKVQKWGNSQGLRLPKHVLNLTDIALGDEVEIIAGDHEILVRKARRSKYDLAALVARIPKGYEPHEVDSGPPVGKEEW